LTTNQAFGRRSWTSFTSASNSSLLPVTGSHLLGMAVARHIVGFPPLAQRVARLDPAAGDVPGMSTSRLSVGSARSSPTS
jgi:hypothetical protein